MEHKNKTKEEVAAETELTKDISGRHGLAVFCQELDVLGLNDVSEDIWQNLAHRVGDRRKHVEAAVHATFSVLGGVPGMAAWAYKNKNLFYPQYMRLAPTESVITGSQSITFASPIGESPLDHVGVDKDGKTFNIRLPSEDNDIPE